MAVGPPGPDTVPCTGVELQHYPYPTSAGPHSDGIISWESPQLPRSLFKRLFVAHTMSLLLVCYKLSLLFRLAVSRSDLQHSQHTPGRRVRETELTPVCPALKPTGRSRTERQRREPFACAPGALPSRSWGSSTGLRACSHGTPGRGWITTLQRALWQQEQALGRKKSYFLAEQIYSCALLDSLERNLVESWQQFAFFF